MKNIPIINRIIITVFGVIIILFLLLGAMGSQAEATAITFELYFEFSGATPPSGVAPWITATFDDSFGDANTVRLTMSTNNLEGTEFVSGWYFNFDDFLDVNQLIFTDVDTSDSVPTIKLGKNEFKADGDGKYDILFEFVNGSFTAGETLVIDITYNSEIFASDFEFWSDPDGGHGPYLTAAHVQGISPDGDNSGWIATDTSTQVPEMQAIYLLGISMIGVFGLKRKLKENR